jgi:glutaredoxin 3
MANVVMYTTMFCPFCAHAKRLLSQKGVQFEEIDVDVVAGSRQEMMARAGGRTSVPQIFIDDTHVGGCDDLFDLEHDGKLDPMLSAA